MRLIVVCTVIIATAVPAVAQERSFLFTTATAQDVKPAVRLDYDVGISERVFQADTANRPEQRIGLHASRGRLILLARFGIADVGSSYQSSQSGEALYSLLGPASRVAVAAGGGMLHEADGVNVLLARVVAARNTDASNLYGNLLWQKAMSSERDALDLITSVGWARKLSRGVSLGLEVIGEDLEGFWESKEAEGGARLLAGPSLHISPAARRWQLTATGGPVFRPSYTGHTSRALRDLPADTRRASYAFKVSLSIALVSSGR